MGEMLEWWLSGGDWADLKQNRRIQDLEQSHHAEVAAVRSSMSRQTSALDSRVDRLERALLAFVELEDTRAELNEFADAAAARRFARDLANRLLGGDAPVTPPAPPADLPGYWLSPAVKAVVADLYPGTGDPQALRAEARRRDDERADLFDVLVAAMGAHEVQVAGQVSRWFPRTPDLSRAERAIATEVARGRFGPEALGALGVRLAELRDRQGIDAVANLVLPGIAAPPPAARPGHEPAAGDERSSAALAELARLVAPLDASAPGDRPDLRDDPLAELLAVMINEGAPGEAPVLQRMATIRTSLAGVGVPTPPQMQTASDAAGTVWALLAEWLADRVNPSTHAVARQVLAPVIVAVAGSLVAAASSPAPSTRSVTVAGTTVIVGPDGAGDASWRHHAERTVTDPPSWVRPAALAGGVVALICAVLAIAAAPVWWVAVTIAAVGAAGAWTWHARSLAETRRARQSAITDGERRIDEQVTALRNEQAAATARAVAARQANGIISTAFAGAAAKLPA